MVQQPSSSSSSALSDEKLKAKAIEIYPLVVTGNICFLSFPPLSSLRVQRQGVALSSVEKSPSFSPFSPFFVTEFYGKVVEAAATAAAVN